MALDREDTLKKAEKLLRQGKLDAAIAEYARVTEEQPRDWNTANTLGDLYVRANQPAKAVEQYARIAEHFVHDGFYPKAAALYKKILKISPNDEQAQLYLAEISAKQGLLVDAKSYFNALVARRRARGDRKGADEIVVRLGTIDPSDIDARIAGARVLALGGEEKRAATLFRDLHADLIEKRRDTEAVAALREAVRLNPSDLEGRNILARNALASGDLETARGYLDRKSAGDDPGLLLALADIELRSGHLDAVREILQKLLSIDRGARQSVINLAWTFLDVSPDAGFVCVDAAVDAEIQAREFDDAASLLQEFVTRRPAHIAALLKLVEVCVDGGLESTMCDAQTQLADAYLAAGQASEARAIAEDLVAREPWEGAHIDRFRRALVMLRISEPDTLIAERLSGATPFVARDHFSGAVEAPATPPEPATELPRTIAVHEAVQREAPAQGAPRNPTAAAAAPPVKKQRLAEIDLSHALGELDGEEERPQRSPTLGDIFKGIRKDAAPPDGADQSAQHMKLARTYLEMGMLQEATACLKTAARSPRQRFEAAATLGRLYKEHGEITDAIEWLERAAEATVPSPEDGQALLYDLGLALEDAGETARALAVFLELQATTGEYRDVAERVDRLARVQTGG
ncbi:MAG TPA: tetratricopeptide repeat protein [Vicinamibacterales bacterium]|nr:tetratricopeptide repeat protein [Vicinamibacterales bacterium]